MTVGSKHPLGNVLLKQNVTVNLPWAKVAAISNDFQACNCAFPKFCKVHENFLCGNKRLLLLLKSIRVFEVNRIEAKTKWILKVFRFDQISYYNLWKISVFMKYPLFCRSFTCLRDIHFFVKYSLFVRYEIFVKHPFFGKYPLFLKTILFISYGP